MPTSSTSPRAALTALLLLTSAACERDGTSATSPTPDGASAHVQGTGLVIVDPPAPYVTEEKLGDAQERLYFHDFGRVLYGEVVERTFHLENREGRAVTIHDLLPSCGCTVPDILARTSDGEVLRGDKRGDGPLLVVPEDASVELRIRVDTRRVPFMNKDKLAQVRMRSDASEPYITFELHLFVQQLLQAEPTTLTLNQVPTSIGASASAWLRATQVESGIRVGDIDSVQGPLTARLEEEQRMGTPVWKLTVEVEPGQPLGALRGSVRITVLDGDGSPQTARFEMPVVGRVVPDVVLDPPALHLTPGSGDDGERGATVSAELQALIPGARVRVLSTELQGEGAERLAIRAVPIDPDPTGRAARWRITLEAPADGQPHSVSGRVRITLDDPTTPEITAPFTSALR